LFSTLIQYERYSRPFFLSLISNASVLVKLVMLILLGVSLTSWTISSAKCLRSKRRAQTEIFERNFWSGGNLVELYQDATSNRRGRDKTGSMERIFEAGMSEYHKVKNANKASLDASAMLDGARRAMRAAYQREMDMLEAHLSFLASVGSVSPYIGLFGTVWGIMNSFRGLANVQQATLAAVAPGIAEALIATAIGLFARFRRCWRTTIIRMTLIVWRFVLKLLLKSFPTFFSVSHVNAK
jgi:biopolymer transport protein TolQ